MEGRGRGGWEEDGGRWMAGSCGCGGGERKKGRKKEKPNFRNKALLLLLCYNIYRQA